MRRRKQEMLSYLLLCIVSSVAIILGTIMLIDFRKVPGESPTATEELCGYSDALIYQVQSSDRDTDNRAMWEKLVDTLKNLDYSSCFLGVEIPMEGIVVEGLVFIFADDIAELTIKDGEFGKNSLLCIGNALTPVMENHNVHILNRTVHVDAIAGTKNGQLNEYIYMNYDSIDEEFRRELFYQYYIPTEGSEDSIRILIGGNDGSLYSICEEVDEKLGGINGLSVKRIPNENTRIDGGKAETVILFRGKITRVMFVLSLFVLIQIILVYVEQRKKDYIVMHALGMHKGQVNKCFLIDLLLVELQAGVFSFIVALFWKVVIQSQSAIYVFKAWLFSWVFLLPFSFICGTILLCKELRSNISMALKTGE